jgi:hypothetical protein
MKQTIANRRKALKNFSFAKPALAKLCKAVQITENQHDAIMSPLL